MGWTVGGNARRWHVSVTQMCDGGHSHGIRAVERTCVRLGSPSSTTHRPTRCQRQKRPPRRPAGRCTSCVTRPELMTVPPRREAVGCQRPCARIVARLSATRRRAVCLPFGAIPPCVRHACDCVADTPVSAWSTRLCLRGRHACVCVWPPPLSGAPEGIPSRVRTPNTWEPSSNWSTITRMADVPPAYIAGALVPVSGAVCQHSHSHSHRHRHRACRHSSGTGGGHHQCLLVEVFLCGWEVAQ